MGAVGASAPTVFESVGASTHGFWQHFLTNPSIFVQMIQKNAINPVMFWQKVVSSTHSFKFLTGALF